MVYQISEKNQILIALFGIVVLCAGKLFKDYLNRGGYIEGFTFATETLPVPLKRGVDDVNATVYLIITLGADLVTGKTIETAWSSTDSSAISSSNIVFTADPANYVATIESEISGTRSPFRKSAVSGNKITFTSTADLKKGSWIKIAISNITLKKEITTSEPTLKFTITPNNGESPVNRDIKVFKADSKAGEGDFVSSTRITASDIKKAIDTIDQRLNASPAPTDADRIALLEARASLVSMLASTYGTVKEAGQVFDSEALYAAQRTAIDFIKKERARAEKNATLLSEDNSNKRRMAQVNTYYTRHYEANTDVMKNIIYVSVALIILAVLRNKELIPASISTLGIILILTFGGIVIGSQVYDIVRRNDHDFDKYDWNFNEDEMNRKQLLQQNSDPANLSEMGMGMAPCYGPGCCDIGTTWDNDSKKCVPAVSRITGTAKWTPTQAGSAAGKLTIILKVSSTGALVANTGKITFELPEGLFTGTPGATGGVSAEGGTLTSKLIELKPTADVVASGTTPAIEITGLSLSTGYSSLSKVIKVKTSADTNASGITISGL
jgi:hypothetical protein